MSKLSRRNVLRLTGCTVAMVPLSSILGSRAMAADMPDVDPADPAAMGLGYVHASETADQNCSNCQLYTGVDGDEWGPCGIFPGKNVNAMGWCKAWVMKAG